MSRAFRAVLWDMDGTLIDSAEYHWITWHETLGELAVELTRDDFAGWFGSRNDRILKRYFEGMSPDEMRRVGELKEERYRALVRRDGITLLPGVGDWLTRLADTGWQQAVASSAPDVVLGAAEKLGVPRVRCVVVEDGAVGVEAGRRGGMRTIWITGPHGT